MESQYNYSIIYARIMNPEITVSEDLHKYDRSLLKLSDYHRFMKQCQEEHIKTLELVRIEPQSYQDQELIDKPIYNINSLACSHFQLIQLTKRIIMSIIPQKQPQLFMENGGYKGQWGTLVQNLSYQIQKGYNPVSYHNFTHGFELMKFLSLAIQAYPQLRTAFAPEEIVITLFAALSHDIGHEGFNNAYYVNTKHPLAQQSNQIAVLENMHARKFLNIAKTNPELDLFCFSGNQQSNKQLAVEMILATDMASHFKHIEKMSQKKNSIDWSKKQDKRFVMKYVFHGCDLNGGYHQDYDEFMSWGGLLAYQFDYQVAMEQNSSVKVSEFMRYRGQLDFYKGQKSFYGNLVLPLWKQIQAIAPSLNFIQNALQTNIEKLCEKIQAKEQKKKVSNSLAF